MFEITTSVLYLYCYFSVIFNALISSLVCLTSIYYCKLKSSDIAAGAPCHGTNGTLVNPALPWTLKPAIDLSNYWLVLTLFLGLHFYKLMLLILLLVLHYCLSLLLLLITLITLLFRLLFLLLLLIAYRN